LHHTAPYQVHLDLFSVTRSAVSTHRTNSRKISPLGWRTSTGLQATEERTLGGRVEAVRSLTPVPPSVVPRDFATLVPHAFALAPTFVQRRLEQRDLSRIYHAAAHCYSLLLLLLLLPPPLSRPAHASGALCAVSLPASLAMTAARPHSFAHSTTRCYH
jgi:hypothetical protein